MKKDMKLGVNLMNKSVIKEMIKEVTGLEVEIEMNAIDGLGNFFLYIMKSCIKVCVYTSTGHVAATVDIVHVVVVAVEPTNMKEEIEIDVATNNKLY